jgi:hypothetical protein
MAPFGFGRKNGAEPQEPFVANITDGDDLEEVKKICQMLKPGGSAFTPNIVFGTDRRIIIKDPSMLGLRENVVDIPYDMISSVRIDKGVFSSNVIFKAPGLINSGRRGTLDKMMEGHGDKSGLAEEDGMIAAIPKNKAEHS